MRRTGVYVCHCGKNIAGRMNVASLARWAGKLPGVTVARQAEHLCSEVGQELLRQDIRDQGLERVVVAACSPRMHEATFRRVVEEAGLNGYLLEIANIREGCAWVTTDPGEALAKAQALVAGAVARVARHRPLETRSVPVNRAVLVVGGGIAGLQAALRVAEAGHPVYLVEREASLGGNMSRFDRTFPTMDCAACTLSALMARVAEHPRIQVMCLSEVRRVEGHVGAFRVEVEERPRYVTSRCTGCGDCEEVCPVELPDPFNEGMTRTRAIGRPFAYAVPSYYRIRKTGEPACRAACPAGVNVPGVLALLRNGQRSRAAALLTEALTISSLAGGFCRGYCQEACGRETGEAGVDMPLIERQLAQLVEEAGHSGRSYHPAPAPRIAVVGSGPAGLAAARRLADLGFRVTVLERSHRPGGMLRWAGAGQVPALAVLEAEIERLGTLGVELVTGVTVGRGLPLSRLVRDYDAVVLACGAWQPRRLNVPGEDLPGVHHALPFLRELRAGRLRLAGRRVLVVGAGDTGLDLAVSAAREGASEVRVLDREPVRPGVRVLPPQKVPIRFYWGYRVTGFAVDKEEVLVQGSYSQAGHRAENLVADIVVIAAGQRPETGEMAGERLVVDSEGRLVADGRGRTPRQGIFAAGDVVTGGGSVPAALAAGRRVAEAVRDFLLAGPGARWEYSGPDTETVSGQRRGVDSAAGESIPQKQEKSWEGGSVQGPGEMTAVSGARSTRLRLSKTLPGEAADPLLREAARCRNCSGCAECGACAQACRAGAVNLTDAPRVSRLEVGAIILATGYQAFDPSIDRAWGYRYHPDVLTGFEFERLCSPLGPTGGRLVTSAGKEPAEVAVLHCVGSRDRRYHSYCSRVCCMAALKFARTVREQTEARVYELYVDLRATGKGHEDFLRRVQEEGVFFIRGRGTRVEARGERLLVRAEDTLLGAVRELEVDMVILCTAFEPRGDAEEVGRTFGVQRDADGFFLEAHPKMAPMETAHEGIFLAGACQGPKDITESLAHAAGAAAQALSFLAQGEFRVSPGIAHVEATRCSGCGICLAACPYEALVPAGGKVAVQEAVCRGCGICLPACPGGALSLLDCQEDALAAQVAGLLSGEVAWWGG
ncbi:hypothetical protein SY88_18540 [Clostridiales bacterium PH28_bin88]|nr:hypothetical protein SY88_18540 [Clostridiales bacterium PH28_bin88]